jgi:GTP-binding protein
MERRDAIVSDVPGTTRDRLLGDASWDGYRFTLVDTGGLEPSPQDPLIEKVKAQVETAVSEADLIIFLLDVAYGLTPMDTEIANWLRRTRKPLVVAVNKVDNEKREISAAEFYQLGLEDHCT